MAKYIVYYLVGKYFVITFALVNNKQTKIMKNLKNWLMNANTDAALIVILSLSQMVIITLWIIGVYCK